MAGVPQPDDVPPATTPNPDIIYVFATKAGAPTNPDWYHNLTAAGDGDVELGTNTYKVTVRELTGAERDRIYGRRTSRRLPPGLQAEYARQTAGVRTIPACWNAGGRSPPVKGRPARSGDVDSPCR